eukprot:scaffold100754_cov45-Phaeocystis_antarctica.AAC.2
MPARTSTKTRPKRACRALTRSPAACVRVRVRVGVRVRVRVRVGFRVRVRVTCPSLSLRSHWSTSCRLPCALPPEYLMSSTAALVAARSSARVSMRACVQ